MTTSPGTLRVVASLAVAPDTREVHVERSDGRGFEFSGGQYVIVNTGVTAPNGKPAKRAYSLMPAPEGPGECRFTVKCLGLGSRALAHAAAGTELAFSGPWGKLVSRDEPHRRTLFVATDTGITAALGVAERAHPGREADALQILWLRSEDDAFLDVDETRERVTRAGAALVHAVLPAVNHPERIGAARARIAERLGRFEPEVLLAAGDGNIVYPLRDAVRPHPLRDVRIECFFNNPERKAS